MCRAWIRRRVRARRRPRDRAPTPLSVKRDSPRVDLGATAKGRSGQAARRHERHNAAEPVESELEGGDSRLPFDATERERRGHYVTLSSTATIIVNIPGVRGTSWSPHQPNARVTRDRCRAGSTARARRRQRLRRRRARRSSPSIFNRDELGSQAIFFTRNYRPGGCAWAERRAGRRRTNPVRRLPDVQHGAPDRFESSAATAYARSAWRGQRSDSPLQQAVVDAPRNTAVRVRS
jgi:hypothetical protein